MAKVGLWLHGARGKLAGATLYKGVGGTQIRQIVDPENPMTEGQAMQRMIFSTVGHAWKAISPYIANKWQNAPNNKIAFRQFFRNNIAYIKAGVLAGSIDHSFNIKGSHVFAPNVYQVASGTLNPITPNGLETINNGTFDILGLNIPCNDAELLDNWEIQSYQDYVKVLANIGCKPGDTLTVITVESKENDHDASYNGAVNDRVKINVEFVRFKQNYDEEMNGLMLINADRSISNEVIAEKSNGSIYIGGSVFSLNQAVIGLQSSRDYNNYCAGAVIRSRRYNPDKEYDLRELSSNARFVIAESELETATVEKVLPSYMGIADPTEDKFLNKEIPEYPIYDGGDSDIIQNLKIYFGVDEFDNDDLSDWVPVFDDSITSMSPVLVSFPANISTFTGVVPLLKINNKMDHIYVNGMSFELISDSQDTNGLWTYRVENYSEYDGWNQIFIEGSKDLFNVQEISLAKNNKAYTIKYNLIIKIKAGDEDIYNTDDKALLVWEGTAVEFLDQSNDTIYIPKEVYEATGDIRIFVNFSCYNVEMMSNGGTQVTVLNRSGITPKLFLMYYTQSPWFEFYNGQNYFIGWISLSPNATCQAAFTKQQ